MNIYTEMVKVLFEKWWCSVIAAVCDNNLIINKLIITFIFSAELMFVNIFLMLLLNCSVASNGTADRMLQWCEEIKIIMILCKSVKTLKAIFVAFRPPPPPWTNFYLLIMIINVWQLKALFPTITSSHMCPIAHVTVWYGWRDMHISEQHKWHTVLKIKISCL